MSTLNDATGAVADAEAGSKKRKQGETSSDADSGDAGLAANASSAAESKRQRTDDGSALGAATSGAGSVGSGGSQDEKCELRFMLPCEVVGSVIGKAGATVGPSMVRIFCCSYRTSLTSLSLSLSLPLSLSSSLPLPLPAQIHNIRNNTGVNLHVDKQMGQNSVERCVKILGTVSQVEAALTMVHEAAEDLDPAGYGAAEARMLIPAGKIGGIIGKRGATISELRTASKCDIHVDNEDFPYADVRSRGSDYGRVRLARIKGAGSDVCRAKMLITQKLMEITGPRDRMGSMGHGGSMGYGGMGGGYGDAAAAGAAGMNGMPAFDARTGMYAYGAGGGGGGGGYGAGGMGQMQGQRNFGGDYNFKAFGQHAASGGAPPLSVNMMVPAAVLGQ